MIMNTYFGGNWWNPSKSVSGSFSRSLFNTSLIREYEDEYQYTDQQHELID
jgi:hypothetical protein